MENSKLITEKVSRKKNHNGGTYMQAQSFISEKSAFIQLTDMDFYMLLKTC